MIQESIKNYINGFVFSIAVILLVSSSILAIDLPRVDDIPYYNVIEQDIVGIDHMEDSVDDGKISFIGTSPATVDIDISKGDIARIKVNLDNLGLENVEVHVDLWGEGYDRLTEERKILVLPGTNNYKVDLSYFRNTHPDNCKIRFFSYDEGAEIQIISIRVDIAERLVNGNKTLNYFIFINLFVLVVSLSFCTLYLIIKHPRPSSIIIVKTLDVLYLLATVLTVTVGVLILYRKARLDYPLVFNGGDDLGVFYLVKTIKEYGITLVNHRNGGLTGGDMFDYVYSDKLSFILVKLISCFNDNVYLITNVFYFMSYVLISVMSFISCSRMGFNRFAAYFVSVLYSFSPFIQARYSHMWLVPYYMIPLACMISLDIANGKLEGKDGNRIVPIYLVVSFFCGCTGMYYALFTCILLFIGIVIMFGNGGGLSLTKMIKYSSFVFACCFAVIANVIPNIVFWIINGKSSMSEYSFRSRADSEIYGLKFVQMFLPRSGHRIDFFSKVNAEYSSHYPIVNENATATLGVIASIGFLIAMYELICRKEKASMEARFILPVFMLATLGGVGSAISVCISWPMRCYNRMSLVIMFLSLLVFARYLVWATKGLKNKGLVLLLVGVLLSIGFLDQTITYVPPDYSGFEASVDLVENIEGKLDAGDMVFVLPSLTWPSFGGYKNHIGYIESDDLVWSYGAIQGRDESVWQQEVAEENPSQMIQLLKDAGYDGVYLDTTLYTEKIGAEEMTNCSNGITDALGHQPYVSKDGTTYFWELK